MRNPQAVISEPDPAPAMRAPVHPTPLGLGAGVFERDTELRPGGDPPARRLVPQRNAAWVGGLLAGLGARP
ncbi:hypothetical protein ACWD0J_34090 [Streptomyces sp. NPDC003011]